MKIDIVEQLRHPVVMETFFIQHGLLALFLLGFFAATLVPLGSEWLLVTLLLKGYDPALTVGVATIGNTLGALTNWLIGCYGGSWLMVRVLRIDERLRARAECLYQRYGVWSLLLAWVPVIGDALCLVGGLLRVRLGPFTLLVTVGKLGRYVVVALLTLTAYPGTGG